MKSTANILLAASILVAVFAVQDVAGDEETTSELKELLQEIKSLRGQMERLELRIERLEQRSSKNDREDFPRHVPRLRGEDEPPSLFEWQQHEMPWLPLPPEHDKGLYVFPGLDAPPNRR